MKRHRASVRTAGVASLFLLSSCASKEAVSVSGSIGNVAVTVAEGSLVTTIEGHFDVSLELGARASSATDVTFSEFALVRASDRTPVLAREKLSVIASTSTPVHLEPGGKTVVAYQIGDLRNGVAAPAEIDQADYASVCGAGQLVINGTMQDTASGASSTPLYSPPFTPSGC